MKKMKPCLATAGILLFSLTAFAQEVDLTKGDLSILKGVSSINIELTYEKMAIGDFNKEADYIKKRRDELNAKEPGSGDTWAVRWEEDKKKKFVEKFALGFTNLSNMTVDSNAKYTLIFNTRALEPGYQVGISKKNAGVDGNVTIVETEKRDKKLIILYVERAPDSKWRGAAFDAGSRIADAYYLDGQKVGKFIIKNTK